MRYEFIYGDMNLYIYLMKPLAQCVESPAKETADISKNEPRTGLDCYWLTMGDLSVPEMLSSYLILSQS